MHLRYSSRLQHVVEDITGAHSQSGCHPSQDLAHLHLPTKPPRGARSTSSSGESEARGAFSSLQGQIKQTPPRYSHPSGRNSLRGSQESFALHQEHGVRFSTAHISLSPARHTDPASLQSVPVLLRVSYKKVPPHLSKERL